VAGIAFDLGFKEIVETQSENPFYSSENSWTSWVNPMNDIIDTPALIGAASMVLDAAIRGIRADEVNVELFPEEIEIFEEPAPE